MKITLSVLVLLLGYAACASAQTPIVEYDLRVYTVGAVSPVQTSVLAPSDITCNLPIPAGTAITVNPDRILWDDPDNAGRICLWTPSAVPGSPLVSLPLGTYEGTLLVLDQAGLSAESNRAPFSRAPLPSARTGLKFYRQVP